MKQGGDVEQVCSCGGKLEPKVESYLECSACGLEGCEPGDFADTPHDDPRPPGIYPVPSPAFVAGLEIGAAAQFGGPELRSTVANMLDRIGALELFDEVIELVESVVRESAAAGAGGDAVMGTAAVRGFVGIIERHPDRFPLPGGMTLHDGLRRGARMLLELAAEVQNLADARAPDVGMH